MASVYLKRGNLWCRVKIAGKWRSRPTPYGPEERAKAERFAAAAQAAIDKRERSGDPSAPESLTVAAYARRWLPEREQAGIDWRKDRGILHTHILPAIGSLALVDVKPAHLAELVRRLRHERGAAPRTVRNVYSVASALFRDAAIAGHIASSPCILTHQQLGKIRDKDPEWRAGALFTRDEAERMISDDRIPVDRRLVYGFGLLAGLRPGEIGALRWRHYDAAAEPLGRLQVALSYSSKRGLVKSTKTETSKTIPVHPTLAAMIAEWRLSGWAALMGRKPEVDDLLVPLPPADAARRSVARRDSEPFRGDVYTRKRWVEVDEPMLGWRHREVYATKATFISLAIDDGADPAIIRDRVTHTKPRRSAFDGYDRGPHWRQTCAEVAKLRIARRLAPAFAPVIPLAQDSAGLDGSGGGFRTIADRAEDRTRWPVVVGGYETSHDLEASSRSSAGASLLPQLARAVLAGDELTARRLAEQIASAEADDRACHVKTLNSKRRIDG